MAGNMIGHEGIRYICEMLRENDIITHLVSKKNQITVILYHLKLVLVRFKRTLLCTPLHANDAASSLSEVDCLSMAKVVYAICQRQISACVFSFIGIGGDPDSVFIF